MPCGHDWQRLLPRPFQRLPGAAWLVAWCKRCGDVTFTARNPQANQPMVDQVEEAA